MSSSEAYILDKAIVVAELNSRAGLRVLMPFDLEIFNFRTEYTPSGPFVLHVFSVP